MIFKSVLEQYQILPYVYIPGFSVFVPSNQSLTLALFFFIFFIFYQALFSDSSRKNTLAVVPSNWQLVLEFFHLLIISIVSENIKSKDKGKFVPLITVLFLYILGLNLFGLVPYSYTLTSQLVITLTLSLSVFIGINIISTIKHGLRFFALFLPAGTTVLLGFLLVPIEFISYIFKPISLAVRLFANMMAGHTLLKVIAGFASTLTFKGGFFTVLSIFPLIVLIPLYGLELAVALIQSYVFVVLVCIYIQDSIAISH